MCLGAVSLTLRELPKIFSRKYTTPEITFMVRISIWKFVRVPKARARETLVKQPPEASKIGPMVPHYAKLVKSHSWSDIKHKLP